MLARITPSPLKGTVPAIASKSMAHRLIICAALANGETHVTCNTTCADIEATVRCLTALGARIETVEDGFQVHPTMKSIEFGLLKALPAARLTVAKAAPRSALCCPSPARWAQKQLLWVRDAWAHARCPRSRTRSSPPAATCRVWAVFRSRRADACARAPLCCRAT